MKDRSLFKKIMNLNMEKNKSRITIGNKMIISGLLNRQNNSKDELTTIPTPIIFLHFNIQFTTIDLKYIHYM